MIYQQTPLMNILAFLTILGLTKRLKEYLEAYFKPLFSLLVSATILLHPLSIDAFLAPNMLKGSVAFWLFLEALFLLRDKKIEWSLLLMMVASICNISYSLFPIFYFLKYGSRKYLAHAVIYILILGLFYSRLILASRNPLSFESYFIQTLVTPFYLTTFTPALFSFSIHRFAAALITLLLILWAQQKNKSSQAYWPMLFLPAVGSMMLSWSEPYTFWSKILFNSSSYLCITFAFITMLAIHIPKKVFVLYFCLLMMFTIDWGMQWRPPSKAISESVYNLPQDYPELITAKRTLGWEMLYEGHFIEGKTLLEELSRNNPSDEDLKQEVQILKSQKFAP